MKDNVRYKFLYNKNGRDVYQLDISSIVSQRNEGADNTFYEVCPVCRDRHAEGSHGFYRDLHYNKCKLGVLPDLSMAHCNRCDSLFINRNEYSDVRIPNIHFKSTDFVGDITVSKLKGIESIMKSASKLSKAMIATLQDRNSTIDPEFNELATLKQWDRPNILTPMYINGELVYYQLRFLDDEAPKCFMPSINNKPPFIPKGCNSHKIIICEGTYDALAIKDLFPDSMPFALLGSHITPYHINILRKFYTPDEILIYMDKVEISKDVAKVIMDSPLKYYIDEPEIIEPTGDPDDPDDPEEHLRRIRNQSVKLDIAKVYANHNKR